MSLRKGKKEYEVIQDILSYTETTLKDSELERKDLLKHFEECPFCGSDIVECPFCHSAIPFRYKCSSCGRVLPLESLIEALAKKTIETKLSKP
jgi:predicted RNA-binding Zn-ribbon protein involved in translation (DUF1610 family)